jgi:drug/metabolite transporter (DMT)-like permease
MNTFMRTLSLLMGLSCIGVCADTLLKLASEQARPFWNVWFVLGLACSAAFAVLWMLLVQTMKLAVAGVFCAVLSALLLVVVGMLLFEERLSGGESAGIAMAVISVVLLSRVSA